MEKTAYEEYVVGKDANQTADGDSVKCYLADMGNIELLSASDENRLSERILRGQCVLALKKEQDKADILGKNIFEINGLMISSPQFSSSSNISQSSKLNISPVGVLIYLIFYTLV